MLYLVTYRNPSTFETEVLGVFEERSEAEEFAKTLHHNRKFYSDTFDVEEVQKGQSDTRWHSSQLAPYPAPGERLYYQFDTIDFNTHQNWVSRDYLRPNEAISTAFSYYVRADSEDEAYTNWEHRLGVTPNFPTLGRYPKDKLEMRRQYERRRKESLRRKRER